MDRSKEHSIIDNIMSQGSNEIPKVRGIVNRDPGNAFLTRAEDAWMRLARYCQLYERGGIDKLLAEIDENTLDEAIHVDAVLLMAVRLATAVALVHGTPASRTALAFARAPKDKQNIYDRLWLPN